MLLFITRATLKYTGTVMASNIVKYRSRSRYISNKCTMSDSLWTVYMYN